MTTLVLTATFQDDLVSQYQNVKPVWILLQQEMLMEVEVVTAGTLKTCKTPVRSLPAFH